MRCAFRVRALRAVLIDEHRQDIRTPQRQRRGRAGVALSIAGKSVPGCEEEATMPVSGLRIALISHVARKPARVECVSVRREALSRHVLCATGTPAPEVMQACPGLQLEEVLRGPQGGDQQVGARIASRHPNALAFVMDLGSLHPHENDAQALSRIAVATEIPLALNRASAVHRAEARFLTRGQG
jgi:methylglyoxal synthase